MSWFVPVGANKSQLFPVTNLVLYCSPGLAVHGVTVTYWQDGRLARGSPQGRDVGPVG